MKTFQKLSFLLAMASLMTLASCGDDDPDPIKSDAEIIGSGIAWKVSTATTNGISVISLIDDCLLDNLVTFNYETPISIGVVDDGPTKCDPADPQTVDFTWSYSDATKILTVNTDIIDIPGAEGDLIVESVTPTQLVLSQNVALPGFGTQKVIVTLVH
ncbi:hypothetical protein [Algoriphagus sp.]|uniref:hypothetical protein n=1 Tax=Algoriphagus sp. TaxID=1872435 RepID=UPI0032700CA3